MSKNSNNPNSNKVRVAVDAKMRLKVDGQDEQNVDFSYEVILTTERIEYFVQTIASGIAKIASKIAEPEKNGARSRSVRPEAAAVS
jgi:uncharacterized lipoprotein YmbA